jgi:hypothetical protein
VLKMHFFPFDYIEKQKLITKYKQILPTMLTMLYKEIKKVSHSIFETGLLVVPQLSLTGIFSPRTAGQVGEKDIGISGSCGTTY